MNFEISSNQEATERQAPLAIKRYLTLAMLIICIFGVLENTSGQVYAQTITSEMQILLTEVSHWVDRLEAGGFSIESVHIDPMTSNETYLISHYLYRGNEYLILGVSGVEITDLDLGLSDSSGTLLVTDPRSTNLPILAIIPTHDGLYTVETDIYSTSHSIPASSPLFFANIIAFRSG